MRVMHVLNQFYRVTKVPGDVIECGVGAGHTTFPLAQFVSEHTTGKTVYACDTYSGLPYDDAIESTRMCKAGELNNGNQFKTLLKGWGNWCKNITMVEGLVEETLPAQLADKQFCFAWLDLDLYVPTRFCLEFLLNRVPVMGTIGLHDYGFHRCPGIERAVKEVVGTNWVRQLLPGHCMFLRRVS